MQWQVDGADRQTGEDKAFLITADTEDDARAIGEAQGIYVSAVVPYVDDGYAEPEPPAPPDAPLPEAAPPPAVGNPYLPPARTPSRGALGYARPDAKTSTRTYADVPGAASRLRAADAVLSIFGWIYVVLGVLGGLIGIALTVASGMSLMGLVPLLYALALIAAGVLLLGAGAAMRMLASIGLATVEIARRKD